MSPTSLNEREFELINIIGAELASNQRDLSRHMDLSLGMTNMLIRRLIAKGHIRIQQLNKRKVQYILTPQGFSEKMRKSVKYTVKTLILRNLHEQGEKNFFVLGETDLGTLVQWVLKEARFTEGRVITINDVPADKIDGIILICREDMENTDFRGNRAIDLLKELAHEVTARNGGTAS
jgi:DNA-binding MarR family transcriptional regulator